MTVLENYLKQIDPNNKKKEFVYPSLGVPGDIQIEKIEYQQTEENLQKGKPRRRLTRPGRLRAQSEHILAPRASRVPAPRSGQSRPALCFLWFTCTNRKPRILMLL